MSFSESPLRTGGHHHKISTKLSFRHAFPMPDPFSSSREGRTKQRVPTAQFADLPAPCNGINFESHYEECRPLPCTGASPQEASVRYESSLDDQHLSSPEQHPRHARELPVDAFMQLLANQEQSLGSLEGQEDASYFDVVHAKPDSSASFSQLLAPAPVATPHPRCTEYTICSLDGTQDAIPLINEPRVIEQVVSPKPDYEDSSLDATSSREPILDVTSDPDASRPPRPDSSCLYDYESSERLPTSSVQEQEDNDATPQKYPSLQSSRSLMAAVRDFDERVSPLANDPKESLSGTRKAELEACFFPEDGSTERKHPGGVREFEDPGEVCQNLVRLFRESQGSVNQSLENREALVRDQIARLRKQAADTVETAEQSGKQQQMLTHKLLNYDAKMESFEKKILELAEQAELTKRELETTRMIINDTTSGSPMATSSPRLHAFRFPQAQSQPISPLSRSFFPAATTDDDSLDVRQFEMDSQPGMGGRLHFISQSPLLSNIERVSQLNKEMVLINDTYTHLRWDQQLQSQETIKRKPMRRSQLTLSSVSSFQFDNDIDEGFVFPPITPVKTIKLARTPFQDLRKSKSLTDLSSEAAFSMASDDFANFKSLLHYYQKKLHNFQEQRLETERENARLKQQIQILQTRSDVNSATAVLSIPTQASNDFRDTPTSKPPRFPTAQSFYPRDIVTSPHKPPQVIFKSELTLLDKRGERAQCRIL